MMTAGELAKRWERLLTKRATWEPVWQELAEYILPNKATVTLKRTPGTKNTQNLYDATAIHASEMLASSLHGALTSPAMQWFNLRMRDETLNEEEDITEWLEDCSLRMLRAMNQSMFNSEVQETFIDLVVFGTGALFEDELPPLAGGRFGGLVFRSFPVGTYCIEEDERGLVNEFDYTVMLNARTIASNPRWAVHPKIMSDAEKYPEKEYPIIHFIMPRLGGKVVAGQPSNTFPVASWILDQNNKHIMWEGGFHEFPVHVPRFRKTSGEIFGRGPGHTALPDVRTLNRATDLGLQEWAKVINPPLEVLDEAIVTEVKLTPAALNVVSQMGSIKPIMSGAKFEVDKVNKDSIKESIRNIFFADQLVVRDGPQKTAEEVRIRYQLMQRLLGPTIGRLEAELLNTLIERTFGIMYRAKAFKPEPQTLIEAKRRAGGEIDIVYEGPMSKSQRSIQAEAITEFMGFCAQMAQLGYPEALKIVKPYEALAEVADIKGVPKKALNSQEEMEQDIEEEKAAMAEAQQAQIMSEKMKGLKDASAALTAGQSATGGNVVQMPGMMQPGGMEME